MVTLVRFTCGGLGARLRPAGQFYLPPLSMILIAIRNISNQTAVWMKKLLA